jgi:hypothetical protein
MKEKAEGKLAKEVRLVFWIKISSFLYILFYMTRFWG